MHCAPLRMIGRSTMFAFALLFRDKGTGEDIRPF
jgi:hypothetical protein